MEKYAQYAKEIPIRSGVGSFETGAIMDGQFLGVDSLAIRYGLVNKTGMIEEETPLQHTHDYDQMLWFLSTEPDDMISLDAEVEFTMGEELIRQRLDNPSAILIPKGTPHFSPIVTRLGKPFFFLAVSSAGSFHADVADPDAKPDAGPWG